MKRTPTPNERALWRLIRDPRLGGLKFRRRVAMGQYFVDFICFSRRLIVEADGSTFVDSAYERRREAWLIADGYRVLRFANPMIQHDPRGVVAAILAAASATSSPATPDALGSAP